MFSSTPSSLIHLFLIVDDGMDTVRRRMIWNSRADFVADGLGSSGSGYAA
jgi:hypothetical protein